MTKHIGSHGGVRRKASHICNMTVEVSVTIEWPEGIPFDEDACKDITSSAVRQRWEVDVGRPGKIVWAQCSADCSEIDVVVEEYYEV